MRKSIQETAVSALSYGMVNNLNKHAHFTFASGIFALSTLFGAASAATIVTPAGATADGLAANYLMPFGQASKPTKAANYVVRAANAETGGLNDSQSDAQVMVGAHVGSPGDANWQYEFAGLETQLGRSLAIDSDYANWASFPDTPRLKWDVQTGHVAMQSWRIEFSETNPNSCATAAAINAGVYDTQIMRQARAVKAVGGVVLVRFNYEMTDNEENTCFTGFPVNDNMPLAAREFVTAWRRVVSEFRSRWRDQRPVGVGAGHRCVPETASPACSIRAPPMSTGSPSICTTRR